MQYERPDTAQQHRHDAGYHSTSDIRHAGDCGCEGDCSCDAVSRQRNRYYTGKYLTARSFAVEQEYFLSRHRLHNRMLHGWGIICGLDVQPHKNPECRATWVVVKAGIALDCCGREIILDKDVAFELPQRGEKDADYYQSPVLLAIRYVEERTEWVPVLYHEADCDPNRREADRICEHYEFEVLRNIPECCWAVPGGSKECPCRDEEEDGSARPCLAADCPCGELVPLALLTFDRRSDIQIDTRGRRQLPVSERYLTHICYTNWEHGDEIPLSRLRGELQGRLEVRFDRKLLPANGDATGINAYTFVVQYGNIQRDLEFLHYKGDGPYLKADDPCTAVFEIEDSYLGQRDNIAGSMVFVTLKCNFILDVHQNSVDGYHKGVLPSGMGVPGGTFESWFRVVADRDGYGQEQGQEAP
jgi:hypothetical protein